MTEFFTSYSLFKVIVTYIYWNTNFYSSLKPTQSRCVMEVHTLCWHAHVFMGGGTNIL